LLKPTDLFLIAVVNRIRDLEFARVLGWYRIPMRHAPKIVRVDSLAFYQTADFGAEKWSIRYFAEVRGVELVRRVDLLQAEPDHPRAGEEYYKMQLGPLESLPRAIPATAWKRLTFLYTTGARLLTANSIEQLAVRGSEQRVLWGALRERSSEPFSSAEAIPQDWEQAVEWLMNGVTDPE
jgi:hypothetical protein